VQGNWFAFRIFKGLPEGLILNLTDSGSEPMKYLSKLLTFASLFAGILLVTGCGGGGDEGGNSILTYTGNTAPAAVSASNAQAIGNAAADATIETIQNSEVGDVLPIGAAVTTSNAPDSIRRQVNASVKHIWDDLRQNSVSVAGVVYTADQLNDMASQESGQTVEWFCGGSMDVPSDPNASSGSITLYNLCFDLGEPGIGPMIMNGRVIFLYSETGDSWTETTTYSGFTVTINGETYTLNGTETCTGMIGSFESSCADLFTGEDGQTYQIADTNYNGDPVSGYNFDATFYHPSYGSVEISTTSSITFNCGNRIPDSGTINFVGAGGSSGSVTFNNCTSYTITYNDGAGDIGTINGVW
jgi:hypothetical protein